MKKRILILSLVVAFCIVFSVSVLASDDAIEGGEVVLSTAEVSSFSDVPRNAWYKASVNDLVARGILAGYPDGTFKPNVSIDRASTTQLLYKSYAGAYGSIGSSPFTDVSNSHWAKTPIVWAYQKDVVSGMGNNRFEPNMAISRQDFACMIVRYCKNAEIFNIPLVHSKTTFKDNSSISSYAVDAVYTLQKAGIISGYSNQYFYPKNSITRGEAAKIVSGIINKLSANTTVDSKNGRLERGGIPILDFGYMCYSTVVQHYRKTGSHITFYDVKNTIRVDSNATSLGTIYLDPGGLRHKAEIKYNGNVVKEQHLNVIIDKTNSDNPYLLGKASYPAKKFSSSGTYNLSCPAQFAIGISEGGFIYQKVLEHNYSYVK